MDPSSARLWRTIADSLRTDIVGGQYPPGERLPSRRELAQRFGTAQQTVQTAVEQLRHEGLVESRPGLGWFARERGHVLLHRSSPRWVERNARLLRAGTGEQQRPQVVLRIRFEKARGQVAADLGVDARTPLCVREREVHGNGGILHVGRTYLPRTITRGTPLEDGADPDAGTYEWLARCGHRPLRFTETVAIVTASEAEARLLGVDPSRPPTVLRIGRVAHAASRRVEVDYLVAPVGRLRLVYELPGHG